METSHGGKPYKQCGSANILASQSTNLINKFLAYFLLLRIASALHVISRESPAILKRKGAKKE